VPERARGWDGLGVEDVEGGAGEAAGAERGFEGTLVEERSAGDVDDDRARRQSIEHPGVDQTTRVGRERRGDHEVVGVAHGERELTGAEDGRKPGQRLPGPSDRRDAHAESARRSRDPGTDRAVTEQQQLLSRERRARKGLPLSTGLLSEGARELTREREQQRQDVVSHTVGVQPAAVGDNRGSAQADDRKQRVDPRSSDLEQPEARRGTPIEAGRAAEQQVFAVGQAVCELFGSAEYDRFEPVPGQRLDTRGSLRIPERQSDVSSRRVRHSRRCNSVSSAILRLVSDFRLARRGFLGLTLASSAAAGQAGLVIRSVALGSDAERAGIAPGDVLLSLDRNPATDIAEVRTILRALRAGDPLLLELSRGEHALELELEITEYPRERYAAARTELGQVRSGDVWLRTIAVVPDTRPPHPVVVYLPGAHWASEEYPLDAENPVPALASALSSAGVAMLRIERSGVGDSQGPACTRVDFETELAGYRAGLEQLLGSDWALPERVFLFGHSLGAMVAPLLAESARVAGIVTFGASAMPISEGLVGALLRHAAQQPDRGAAERRALRVCELVRLVCAGQTPAEVFVQRPELASAAPAHFSADQAYQRVVRFYHQLENADLHGAWSRADCDVLAIHGSDDWITTLDDSRAIAAAAGKWAETLELDGIDHQLSPAGSVRPKLAPELATAIVAWIRARL
jgi:pimeloyl-ACP methyl ester carboxylesterase